MQFLLVAELGESFFVGAGDRWGTHEVSLSSGVTVTRATVCR
jgi:hypothetical protein